MPMVAMGEVVPGTIMGTFFTTLNLVDLAMCWSGTDVALTYYRAWPLPIIGSIKNFMIVLLPLILVDAVVKIRAFIKARNAVTYLGLLTVFTFAALFYTIPVYVVPSEEAAKEPMRLSGKAKAAAEEKLVADLTTGVVYMLGINFVLLVLPLVTLNVESKQKKA